MEGQVGVWSRPCVRSLRQDELEGFVLATRQGSSRWDGCEGSCIEKLVLRRRIRISLATAVLPSRMGDVLLCTRCPTERCLAPLSMARGRLSGCCRSGRPVYVYGKAGLPEILQLGPFVAPLLERMSDILPAIVIVLRPASFAVSGRGGEPRGRLAR